MTPAGATNQDLARRIYELAHLEGEFVLRSGRVSNEYFDKYRFEADPRALREVAEAMVPLVPERVDALAGLELGGVPLVTMLGQLTGLPTLFVRKAAKGYGTRRLAEGGDVAGRRIAVVEDVVTSGGQLLASCAALRGLGAEIAAVLCAIDRETGGAESLAAEGLGLRPLFTMRALRAAVTAKVERSRDVAAPPDAVYAAISDVRRMGEWSDECYACDWVDRADRVDGAGGADGADGAGAPTVGAVFEGHNRNGEHEWTSQCTVVEAEPGRSFVFECSMFGVHYSTWGYRIEPTDSGSTVTEWSQDFRSDQALHLSTKISGRPERSDRRRSAERNGRSMSGTLDRLAEALERT